MANLSTYAADKLLDALLRNVPYTSTDTYVALFTALPVEPSGSGGLEVVGGSYVRLRLDTLLNAAASGSIDTNADLTWPEATANWGTVVGVGIYDALTNGNLLASGALTESQAVGIGATFQLPAGQLSSALA